jgi:hypothetical protein
VLDSGHDRRRDGKIKTLATWRADTRKADGGNDGKLLTDPGAKGFIADWRFICIVTRAIGIPA